MYESKRAHCNATCMHRVRLQVGFLIGGGWGLECELHTAFFGFHSTMWCCHGDCLRRGLAKMAGCGVCSR